MKQLTKFQRNWYDTGYGVGYNDALNEVLKPYEEKVKEAIEKLSHTEYNGAIVYHDINPKELLKELNLDEVEKDEF